MTFHKIKPSKQVVISRRQGSEFTACNIFLFFFKLKTEYVKFTHYTDRNKRFYCFKMSIFTSELTLKYSLK